MDSKSVKVAIEDVDKVVKVETDTTYGQMPVLDKSMPEAESDYRSAKDAKSQRQLNELYTGKHRASTMYGLTKGHKSNTSFKSSRNKNFQRTKH